MPNVKTLIAGVALSLLATVPFAYADDYDAADYKECMETCTKDGGSFRKCNTDCQADSKRVVEG